MKNAKHKMLVPVVIILAMTIVWYLLFYQPKRTSLKKIKQEITALSEKVKSFAVSDAELTVLRKGIDQKQVDLAGIEARLYAKTELPRIADEIERRGKAHGLQFHAITPSYGALLRVGSVETEEGPSPLIKLPIDFQLEGRYKDFGQFVEEADDYPFIFTVGAVELRHTPELYPRLDIQMTGYVYLLDAVEMSTPTAVKVN